MDSHSLPARYKGLPKFRAERFESCIFCGREDQITDEHAWPQWMRKIIGDEQSHFLDQHSGSYVKGHAKIGNGDLSSIKVRCVCAPCNNGWMSALQISARPVLEPLMKGQWMVLTDDQRELLAVWMTMFSMVWEWTHSPTKLVPVEERQQFRDEQVPPTTWTYWFGRTTKESQVRCAYHASYEHPPGNPPHSQLTTMVAGRLLLQAFSTQVGFKFPVRSYARRHRLRMLWPTKDPDAANPPAQWRAPKDVDEIAMLFKNRVIERHWHQNYK